MAEDNTTNQSADAVPAASEVEPQVTRVRKPSTRKKKTDETVSKSAENVVNEAQESGPQAEAPVPKKTTTKTTRKRKPVAKKEKPVDEADVKEDTSSQAPPAKAKAPKKATTKKATTKKAPAKRASTKKTPDAKRTESIQEAPVAVKDTTSKAEQTVESGVINDTTNSNDTQITISEKPAPKRRGRPRKVVVESVEVKKEETKSPTIKDNTPAETVETVEKPEEKKTVKRPVRMRKKPMASQVPGAAESDKNEVVVGTTDTDKKPEASLPEKSEPAPVDMPVSVTEPGNETPANESTDQIENAAKKQPVKRARRRPGDAGGAQSKTARKYARNPRAETAQPQSDEKKNTSADESVVSDTQNSVVSVPARRPRVKRTRHVEPARSAFNETQPQEGEPSAVRGNEEKNVAFEEVTQTESKSASPSRTQRPMRNGVVRENQRERSTNNSRYERPVRTRRNDNSDKNEQADKSTRYEKNNRNEKNVRSERFERTSQDKQSRYESSSYDKKKEARKPKDTRKRRGIYEPIEIKASKDELHELKVADLREMATKLEIEFKGLKKTELIDVVYEGTLAAEGFQPCKGVLDFVDSHAVIRVKGYLKGPNDVYVAPSLVRRFGLRRGDFIEGIRRGPQDNEKHFALQHLGTVNGREPLAIKHRPKFADLVPVYPDDMLLMEHGKESTTGRTIDLVSPVGKGQRGLIVSPPKAGKTTILKQIAESVATNNPEVHLICLLVDERPEEVTDMTRSIKGEVVASTFDMPAENHIAVSELVIERAKRLVELGDDVVILLDSITRLARAYNLGQPASGRILSGGVDSAALYPPKRFLGAARNIENGGSLTILASALIDTGSKMDEVIFEEFKGTGNMELKLDRDLADRRVYPAVDTVASGTRKEELLLDPELAPLIWGIRRMLANNNSNERAMQMLLKSFKQTDNNRELLIRSAKRSQNNEQN